jgi:hypothetical protein
VSEKAKGVRPVVENLLEDGDSDLDLALHLSIENIGTVDAEISFDASGDWAELPAGMKRELPFVGDRYVGRLHVRFNKADSGEQRVTIIKLTHHC